jgi:hypothetical protein
VIVSDSGGAVGIGFGARQVVVQSNRPEVLTGVATAFGAMLEAPRDDAVGRLAVAHRAGRYEVSGKWKPAADAGSLSDVLRTLRYQVALHLMHARRDLLWLHAGAVADGRGALLFVGPGASGKSTLAAALAARGWQYCGDDVVALDRVAGAVLPFPVAPTVRRPPPRPGMAPEDVAALDRTEVRLDAAAVRRAPARVVGVVFPAYRGGSAAELRPCGPAEAAVDLLRQCLNFPSHREAAVRCVCDLMQGGEAFHLAFSDADRAVELVDRAFSRAAS